MKVNVKINSNLKIRSALGPPMEIELGDGENTLEDVLEKLSNMYSDLILVKNGEMGDDLCQLFLNGESHAFFPEGLKKKINEGDTVLVDIYIDVIAGG